MISAKEAQRLSRSRWQAELDILEYKIREAIAEGDDYLVVNRSLYAATVANLRDQEFSVQETPNRTIIAWRELDS